MTRNELEASGQAWLREAHMGSLGKIRTTWVGLTARQRGRAGRGWRRGGKYREMEDENLPAWVGMLLEAPEEPASCSDMMWSWMGYVVVGTISRYG